MSYLVKCIRCHTSFNSNDEADFDGVGFCPTCKEGNKEIAKRVDAVMAIRMANKPQKEFINPYTEVLNKKKGSVTYFNRTGQIM